MISKPAMANTPWCPCCTVWSSYWQSCIGIGCGGNPCQWKVGCNCCAECGGISGLTCCNGGCCDTGDKSKCLSCVPGLNCVACDGDPNQECCAGAKKCRHWRTEQCCWDTWNLTATVCDKDLGCCNGQCYNPVTQKCCDDGPPDNKFYVCDIDQACCNGSCCPPGKTCCPSDGECHSMTCTIGMSETETLLKLGWSNFSQGNWQDAISYFEKGLAKLPDDNKPTNVLYGLARMYENTGNIQKAEETYLQLLPLMKDEDSQIQKVESHIASLEEKTIE